MKMALKLKHKCCSVAVDDTPEGQVMDCVTKGECPKWLRVKHKLSCRCIVEET